MPLNSPIWNNPGSSSNGGCYYFKHIEKYLSSSRKDAVANICAKSTKCETNETKLYFGDCNFTTQEDQRAYQAWQVEKNMVPHIKKVFGI